MNLSTSNYATLAGREIHWMDWGPKDGPAIVAWHGLARTGRDMDELAIHFSGKGFRVLCPDTIGRGLSQWSPVPDEEYQLSFYARIAPLSAITWRWSACIGSAPRWAARSAWCALRGCWSRA